MDRRIAVLAFGLLAAVAYCSWPVGYLVDRTTASSGLASDLELSGQPFAWLFILLDCLCGLAILIAVGLAWSRSDPAKGRLLKTGLIAYGAFGFATTFDALLPEHCGSVGIASCGANLARPNLDDLLTGVALLALFVACGTILLVRLPSRHRSGPGDLVAAAIFVTWSTCGLIFLSVHFRDRPAVGLQHAMLTLTASLVLCVAFLIGPSGYHRPPAASRERGDFNR